MLSPLLKYSMHVIESTESNHCQVKQLKHTKTNNSNLETCKPSESIKWVCWVVSDVLHYSTATVIVATCERKMNTCMHGIEWRPYCNKSLTITVISSEPITLNGPGKCYHHSSKNDSSNESRQDGSNGEVDGIKSFASGLFDISSIDRVLALLNAWNLSCESALKWELVTTLSWIYIKMRASNNLKLNLH